jgi:tetratricopeptide (TPR) repeat protein
VSADNLFNDLSGFANSRSVDVGYDDAFTKFYRGMNLVHERDYAGALLKYSEAINENQGIWEAYNNRGNVHSILQDNKAAIADFDTAIQLHSKSSESYSNRGLSKSRLGDQEGAIADYDIAISLDPNLPTAFENRGVAKLLNGDFNGALDDFNQSTALEPNMSNLAFTGALLAARGEEGFAEFYFEVIKDRIPMWREELYIFLDMTKPDFAVENIFQGNEAAVRFFQRCIELAEEKLGLQP